MIAPLAIIERTYRDVLPGKFASEAATTMLLAIGYQESRFEHRQQIGGPARSFWQFERDGGVAGVLRHPATARHAQAVCLLRDVMPERVAVFDRMLTDDVLGCAFARLLLYSDPRPLPLIGNTFPSWDYYLRNWRPGKPHPETWSNLYTSVVSTTNHHALA